MKNYKKGRDVTPAMKQLLLSVPVYPKWKSASTQKLPLEAPLAEEHGKICYPTQEAKDWYVERLIKGKSNCN